MYRSQQCDTVCYYEKLVAGTMAPAARGLRAALKEAAGKLVAQLYDRNSRRQFVPPEAFQTDSLPPERFQVEMQTAAAASGGLMQATNTRVWGLLRHAHSPLYFMDMLQSVLYCDCVLAFEFACGDWTFFGLIWTPGCCVHYF